MDETNLKAYCDRALLCAGRYGAQYADIRIVDGFEQFIMVEDGQLEASRTGRSYGFGVRMYLGGAWGFASSCKVTADEIDKVIEQAATIAKANAKVNKIPAILARGEPCQSFYETECKTDPVSLPFEDKFRHLMEVDKAMGLPGISHRCNLILVTRKNKAFASSDGSFIRRNETDTSSYASARVIDDKGSVRRSVPERGLHAGWEFVRSRDMTAKASECAREALMFSKAKPCPQGRKDIVLGTDQMQIQIHESVGHALELDRILGHEANFAGKSFVTPDMLGRLQYGSRLMNITADPETPNALGSYEYDDEGTKAKRIHLVKDGILTGFLNSRETAAQLGIEPMGAMRAEGWNRIPIIRMTCVNLEPGNLAFKQLIGGVDDGIYMDFMDKISIDNMRVNFQFSCEAGYEIVNGRLGEPLRNPSYTGKTLEFWNSCDGLGDPGLVEICSTHNCGKGEPIQSMFLTHATPPARFRNVQVGV